MTVEEGAVSGELVLRLHPHAPGQVIALVAYAGSEDWMTVEGTPQPGDPADPALASQLAGRLARDPGVDEAGNPVATLLD